MKKTLFDKVWDSHVVESIENGPDVLFIDRHMVHEVTSPVAFLGLKNRGIKVRYPERTFATADHNTPTINQHLPVADPLSAKQLDALEENAKANDISFWGLGHKKNGIVHVVGPEYGITQPGATIVCGDSHTSTHGAFGAIAFGIGTSEVEMVLATQCIMQPKPNKMRITIDGSLNFGVTPKDVALFIISQLSTSGATGYFVEYAGKVFRNLSMEGRMTVCNLSIEMGARGGLVAPDEKTFRYLKGKTMSPKGENWNKALKFWKSLYSDKDCKFDKEVNIEGKEIEPLVTWGTSPQDVSPVTGIVPDPNEETNEDRKIAMKRSLEYMGLKANTKISDIKIDKIFIGSCTNGRIEDLRLAADLLKGKKIADNVSAMVVPGSGLVKSQAEEEGIDKIFIEAGFEWREPGCSMCLGMNPDQLKPKERCASTSNRNFEGRQGRGGRTHLVSPGMAVAAAIKGYLSDVREIK